VSHLKIVDTDCAYVQMYEKITAGEYKDGEFNKFSRDMAKIYEIEDHPKKGLLYIIAFDHGSKNGFVGILKEYDILVKLVR